MFDETLKYLDEQKKLLEQLKDAVSKSSPEQQAMYNGFALKLKKAFDLPLEEQEQAIITLHNEFINNFA